MDLEKIVGNNILNLSTKEQFKEYPTAEISPKQILVNLRDASGTFETPIKYYIHVDP
jgi:hypothetical protein